MTSTAASSAGTAFVVNEATQLVTRTAAQVLADIGAAPATGGAYLPLAGGTLTGNLGVGYAAQSNIRTFIYENSSNYTLAVQQDGAGIPFQVTSGSSVRLIVANGGNVGIGTTSPIYKLDVASGSSSSAFGLSLSGTARLKMYADGTYNYFAAQSGQSHRFTTTGGAEFLISNGGNVGIGTTSPGRKLTVTGDASGDANNLLLSNENDTDGDSASIGFSMLSNNTYVKSGIFFKRTTTQGRGDLIFANNNEVNGNNVTLSDAKMTIASGGNVGIGTTSPAKKLHVAGEIQGTNFFAETYRSARTDGDIYIQAATATDFVSIGTQVSPNLMRIEGSGNVGIGTTSPGDKLEVDGHIKVLGKLKLGPSSSIQLDDTPTASTANSSGTIVNWSVSESTTAGNLYAVKTNGGWTAADADTMKLNHIGMLAIALGANAVNGMLLQGFFYKASHGFTIGLPLYISNTLGAFSNTRPLEANDYVRIIGYATSANYIYFDPDKTWVKIA